MCIRDSLNIKAEGENEHHKIEGIFKALARSLKMAVKRGPALYLINKKGETRPMVDLQGKFYLIEDLDDNFVNACVNKEAYAHHAGDYVKNAYDPQLNVEGVWDKKASDKAEDLNIVLCYELKQDVYKRQVPGQSPVNFLTEEPFDQA